MSETDHKLDHVLKVKSEDLIWHMHTFDIDLRSNHIYLFGNQDYVTGTGEAQNEPGVEFSMANRFIRNLNLCMRSNPDKPILIHMKTCGGDWTEGMAIYDAIKSCPFPVTILNYTHARSMSSLIFQAANKRVMMPNSYFLFHDGTIAIEGTVKQVQSSVDFDKLSSDVMLNIYIDSMKRSGKFINRSRKWLYGWLRSQMDRKEDVYIVAKDTVKYGFADQIFDYNWSSLTDYTPEELGRG